MPVWLQRNRHIFSLGKGEPFYGSGNRDIGGTKYARIHRVRGGGRPHHTGQKGDENRRRPGCPRSRTSPCGRRPTLRRSSITCRCTMCCAQGWKSVCLQNAFGEALPRDPACLKSWRNFCFPVGSILESISENASLTTGKRYFTYICLYSTYCIKSSGSARAPRGRASHRPCPADHRDHRRKARAYTGRSRGVGG